MPSKKNYSYIKDLIKIINNVGIGKEFDKKEIISKTKEKRTESYSNVIFSLLKRCEYIKLENPNVYRLLKLIDENKSLIDFDIESRSVKK